MNTNIVVRLVIRPSFFTYAQNDSFLCITYIFISIESSISMHTVWFGLERQYLKELCQRINRIGIGINV